MTESVPRVAFLPDCFEETNGVARTSRELVRFAANRQYPMLVVHAGQHPSSLTEGSIRTVALPRGPLSVALDADLSFDILLQRHFPSVRREFDTFQPDVVHVTGPGDMGILGARLALHRKIPLVISWHTNVHEYGARRLERLLRWLPQSLTHRAATFAEQAILSLATRFYRLGRVLLAPNEELRSMLQSRTGRPVHLMRRGVDTELFHPARRRRGRVETVIGYVGRLTTEKNLRALATLQDKLSAAGAPPFRFEIVGQGSEQAWLEHHLRRVHFAGVLTGEPLAQAYADMDIFVFPSHTDTYGNVVQEAMASGVPPIVTASGGPKFLLTDGVSGFVAHDDNALFQSVLSLMKNLPLHQRMADAARREACEQSWPRVFEGVYRAYHQAIADTGLFLHRRDNPAGNTPQQDQGRFRKVARA